MGNAKNNIMRKFFKTVFLIIIALGICAIGFKLGVKETENRIASQERKTTGDSVATTESNNRTVLADVAETTSVEKASNSKSKGTYVAEPISTSDISKSVAATGASNNSSNENSNVAKTASMGTGTSRSNTTGGSSSGGTSGSSGGTSGSAGGSSAGGNSSGGTGGSTGRTSGSTSKVVQIKPSQENSSSQTNSDAQQGKQETTETKAVEETEKLTETTILNDEHTLTETTSKAEAITQESVTEKSEYNEENEVELVNETRHAPGISDESWEKCLRILSLIDGVHISPSQKFSLNENIVDANTAEACFIAKMLNASAIEVGLDTEITYADSFNWLHTESNYDGDLIITSNLEYDVVIQCSIDRINKEISISLCQ